jgi:hypothetical protein
MRWAWFVAHAGTEEMRQDFGLETEGKKPLGRPVRRRDDDIKMDLL